MRVKDLDRIKELHDAGTPTDEAVRLAITRTAGTVTSAAIIVVAVFGLFASLSMIMMQQMASASRSRCSSTRPSPAPCSPPRL